LRRRLVALAVALVLAGVTSGTASAQTGPVVMFVPRLAPNLAMTAPASAGQPVQLAPQTGAPAQLWVFTNPDFEESPTQIVNQQTGLCLDVASTTAGARVIAAACTGSPSQLWGGSEQGNGSYRFLNLNSPSGTPLVLTAAADTPDVVLARNSGADPRQEWLLQSPGLREPPSAAMPATKDDCANGGWRSFGAFKNRGDCVSFVATGGKNPPAGPPR
jgi:ricin-type beta-trefoil lectin protein